jgi:predicted nuclease with TOPRIM domain
MSSTKNELKTSLKDAKEKCEKVSEENRELKDRLVKIKEDYTKIKIDYDNLLIANELLSCDKHEAINPIVKIDVATSCDDLSEVDQSSLHDELIEKVEVMTLENQKFKKYLTDAITKGKIAIESNDVNSELAVDKCHTQFLEGKPNANHVRAKIRTHVHSDYIIVHHHTMLKVNSEKVL